MAFRTLTCLLSFFAAAGLRSAPVSLDLTPLTVGVLVHFDRKPAGTFFKLLRSEVETIFRPSQLDLRWESGQQEQRPATYNRIVSVEMRGACDPNAGLRASNNSAILGWTTVSDGEMQSHATIDCDEIAHVLISTWSVSANRWLSPTLYARLAGRVVAHELIHILLRTSEHHDSDCARSPLRPFEFVRQPKLSNAEVSALQQIGRPSAREIARLNSK